MTAQTYNTSNTPNSSSITARIEAQDATYIEPLREYLERYGCAVVVNRAAAGDYAYAICVGDGDFVKSFFAGKKVSASRKLGIVYEGGDDGLEALVEEGVKLYYVDPKPLTSAGTKDIFAFFFTGKQKIKNTRKDPVPAKAKSVIQVQPSREQPRAEQARAEASANQQLKEDAQRIAQTMRQVFHQSPKHKASKRMRLRVTARWIFIAILVVLMPALFYVITVTIGGGLLAWSGKMLLSGNIQWTETLRQASIPYIQGGQTMVHLGSPVLDVIGLHGFAEDQDRLLSILSDASLAEDGVVTIFKTSKTVAGSILFPQPNTSATTASDVAALTTEVSRVSQHLSLVQAELDSLMSSRRFPFTAVGVQTLGKRGLSALERVRTMVGYTEQILTLYPEMAGFRKKQTYLVLLQNSMELRPTGGFIGSLLLVSFVDGRVDDMRVVDVYTADGQLKGHVDPPAPIREMIGQEHWYLRDSNWDPDFSVSGNLAGWFYEKEMEEPVDGVIAVSLPVVTRLLHALGPVELPDFNERISEGNFFAKSLLYTQTDFFPGSTQKKDFLGALTNALLLRMTADTGVSAGQLLQVLVNSLKARDVQFYFDNHELEQLVSQWGWAGKMVFDQCQTFFREPACIGDGIAIVEANVGINKANYFVAHEALSDITLGDDGIIRQILTVKIKNTAASSAVSDGAGGAYQAYLRLYLPEGSVVRSVRLDGTDVPERDTSKHEPQPAPYQVRESSSSAEVVGIALRVEPGHERQLVVETRRISQSFSGASSYQFSIWKQSGVSSYPWHVVIHYPTAWGVISESGVAKPGQLEYNTDLSSDAHFRMLFQKPE